MHVSDFRADNVARTGELKVTWLFLTGLLLNAAPHTCDPFSDPFTAPSHTLWSVTLDLWPVGIK